MTEIEEELIWELKQQQRIFGEELRRIGEAYEKNIREARNVIEKQSDIITKQSETLEKYGKVSNNWRINLDQNQMKSLEESNKIITKKLTELDLNPAPPKTHPRKIIEEVSEEVPIIREFVGI